MKFRVPIFLGLAVALASCSMPDSPAGTDAARGTPQLIIVLRPDLTVTNVTVLDYTPSWISYSYTVKNIGRLAAPMSSIAMQAVISADQVFFNAGDVPAGGQLLGSSGNINPGQSVTQKFSASLPAGTIHPDNATQYLLVMADYSNQIAEWNETNNVGAAQIFPKLPDLVVTDVAVTGYTNTSISYSYTVSNIGLLAADKSAIAVQAVISSDLVFFNAGDVPAGGQTLGSSGVINPGESVTQTFSSSVPAGTIHPQSATQYLLVMADYSNAVAEQNEANNVGSVQIVPLLPDLTVTNVSVVSTTATSITYSYTVNNTGSAPADQSSIAVQAVISPDLVFFNAGDVPAGGQILGSSGQILPGQSITQTFTCGLAAGTLHPDTSTQYLLVMADYAQLVTELNENNNVGSVQILP